MAIPLGTLATRQTSGGPTWWKVGFSSIGLARLPEEPYPVHCSSPILSLTAWRNRCLQPRYRSVVSTETWPSRN